MNVLATTAEGLARSTDAGATFTPLPSTDPSWRPLSIDGEAIFLSSNDSLHVSRDGGGSWRAVQDSAWVTVVLSGSSSSFPVPLHNIVGALISGEGVLAAGTAYVFGGVYRLGRVTFSHA
jgi:hypothetical protein